MPSSLFYNLGKAIGHEKRSIPMGGLGNAARMFWRGGGSIAARAALQSVRQFFGGGVAPAKAVAKSMPRIPPSFSVPKQLMPLPGVQSMLANMPKPTLPKAMTASPVTPLRTAPGG